MASRFISGLPGGGKGLLAMARIYEELTTTDRWVVTNFALELEPWANGEQKGQIGLREYLTFKFGEEFAAQCCARIIRITDEQMVDYYRRRGGGQLLGEYGEGSTPTEYFRDARKSGSVFYVLDEVWKAFPAREYRKTSKGAIAHAKVHRHLGDEILYVSQKFGDVDSMLRGVVQEFITVRNWGKVRASFFKGPRIFQTKHYLVEPRTSDVEAIRTETFRLDVEGLAQCYNTAGAVGGRGAGDMAEKTKGTPWWVGVAALVLVVVAGFMGARWFMNPERLKRPHGGSSAPASSSAPARPAQQGVQPVPSSAPPQPPPGFVPEWQLERERQLAREAQTRNHARSQAGAKPEPENEARLTGFALVPGVGTVVFFSDRDPLVYGRDPELHYLDRKYAIADGKLYRFKQLQQAVLPIRSEPEFQHASAQKVGIQPPAASGSGKTLYEELLERGHAQEKAGR